MVLGGWNLARLMAERMANIMMLVLAISIIFTLDDFRFETVPFDRVSAVYFHSRSLNSAIDMPVIKPL